MKFLARFKASLAALATPPKPAPIKAEVRAAARKAELAHLAAEADRIAAFAAPEVAGRNYPKWKSETKRRADARRARRTARRYGIS